MRISVKLRLILSGALLLLIFNNCDSHEEKEAPSASQGDHSSQFVEADFLKQKKPDLLCGESGYEYLLNEYFRVHCSVCHEQGGDFPPAFADKTLTFESYNAARYIDDDMFLHTVSENRFCGTECSLNPEGETYKAIVEWLENKWICP